MDFEEQDYTKGFDLSLWKKIFVYVMRHKNHLFLLILSTVATSFIDSFLPQLDRYAIDTFITGRNLDTLPYFIAIYVVVLLMFSAAVFMFVYQAGRLQTKIVYDVRKDGFNRLQELSFSYYDTTHVGWIMARMTSDSERIGDFISWSFVDGIGAVAYIIFAMIWMLITDVKLTIWVMTVMPVLVIVVYYFQKIILKGHRESRKINSKITGSYNEGINGAKTTKTLVRESRNFDDFEALSSGMRKVNRRVALINTLNFPVVLSLGSLASCFVITFGGRQVQIGDLSLGTISAFLSYSFMLFEPIYQLVGMFSELQSAQASSERTISLLSTEPDIVDSPDKVALYGNAMAPKPENWPEITGDIEFNDVTFAYKTGEKVLENFNLKIKAGERIALVGETGSGKSTIVNLVCRFYEPTKGQVLIDGVDVRERTQIWLQSNLGYVLQTPHLFSGTIKDNIRYAKLDATDEEVIEAAKAVNAYNFIMKFDKGFETDVDEGGNRLSSGEKQLVSFARAIIANPRIFVLDEATSSVDAETEQTIQHAIEKVLFGRTSFIIAHRLSTIRSCDRILVISDGKIIEQGNHKELLRMKGHYHTLYTNQFKEEAEKNILGSGK